LSTHDAPAASGEAGATPGGMGHFRLAVTARQQAGCANPAQATRSAWRRLRRSGRGSRPPAGKLRRPW